MSETVYIETSIIGYLTARSTDKVKERFKVGRIPKYIVLGFAIATPNLLK
ncbi:MAG: hypothetical protein F6J86_13970 [Symploca sp. SIO1B1]|nr:hypothetical protein [Symploca sp. SIO1B1]